MVQFLISVPQNGIDIFPRKNCIMNQNSILRSLVMFIMVIVWHHSHSLSAPETTQLVCPWGTRSHLNKLSIYFLLNYIFATRKHWILLQLWYREQIRHFNQVHLYEDTQDIVRCDDARLAFIRPVMGTVRLTKDDQFSCVFFIENINYECRFLSHN